MYSSRSLSPLMPQTFVMYQYYIDKKVNGMMGRNLNSSFASETTNHQLHRASRFKTCVDLDNNNRILDQLNDSDQIQQQFKTIAQIQEEIDKVNQKIDLNIESGLMEIFQQSDKPQRSEIGVQTDPIDVKEIIRESQIDLNDGSRFSFSTPVIQTQQRKTSETQSINCQMYITKIALLENKMKIYESLCKSQEEEIKKFNDEAIGIKLMKDEYEKLFQLLTTKDVAIMKQNQMSVPVKMTEIHAQAYNKKINQLRSEIFALQQENNKLKQSMLDYFEIKKTLLQLQTRKNMNHKEEHTNLKGISFSIDQLDKQLDHSEKLEKQLNQCKQLIKQLELECDRLRNINNQLQRQIKEHSE